MSVSWFASSKRASLIRCSWHGSHSYSGTDQLLERLKEVHGESRYDIPPELEKHGQRQRG